MAWLSDAAHSHIEFSCLDTRGGEGFLDDFHVLFFNTKVKISELDVQARYQKFVINDVFSHTLETPRPQAFGEHNYSCGGWGGGRAVRGPTLQI